MIKISTKKGIATTILAVLIISVVVGVLLLTVFTGLARAIGGPAVDKALSDLCHFNMGIKDRAPTGTKFAIPNLFCSTSTQKIYADAWKQCDPDETWALKKNKDRTMCAAMQVAQLARTCFSMYGDDTFHLSAAETGKYPCYAFTIIGLGNREIDEPTFTKAMDRLGYCTEQSPFNNNKCSDGDCGYCGNSDNVEWYRNIFSSERGRLISFFDLAPDTRHYLQGILPGIFADRIKLKYNVMCFDERGSWEDAVLMNTLDCPWGNLPNNAFSVEPSAASSALASLWQKPEYKNRTELAPDVENLVTIKADDWDICDPDGSYGWRPTAGQPANIPAIVAAAVAIPTPAGNQGDVKSCAAAQLVQLATNCWSVYGSGSKDFTPAGDHSCFRVESIQNLGSATISEDDITSAMKKIGACQFLENNDACTDPKKCKTGPDTCGTANEVTIDGGKSIGTGKVWLIKFRDSSDSKKPDQIAFAEA